MKKFLSKSEKADFWKSRFEELRQNGAVIYSKDKKKSFVMKEDEVFKQCWADTLTRKYFPARWFVSEEHLVSVYKKRIIYIPKNERKSGRAYYKYRIKDDLKQTDKTRNIEAHNLIWLVWGAPAFGKAEKLLAEKGIDAFGGNVKGEDVVHGHHKDNNIKNSSLSNGKFIIAKVNRLLEDKRSGYNATLKDKSEFLPKMYAIIQDENPDHTTILFTGEHGKTDGKFTFKGGIKDIVSVDAAKPVTSELSDLKFLVTDVYMVLSEEDIFKVEEYVFVCRGNADFIKKTQNTLLSIAKNTKPKHKNIYENMIDTFGNRDMFDYDGKLVFWGYDK